uniref:Uncharacterized protein n=1 Tax=Arundo donax TaxID=35708 RepID=A0A0A9BR29_ARUDO
MLAPLALRASRSSSLLGSAAVAGRTSTAVDGRRGGEAALARCCPMMPVPRTTSMLLNMFVIFL